MKKIAIIGAESTGKTILCEQLAKHFNTVFVPEFARSYFNENDINNYSINDLEVIAKKQLTLEADYEKQATDFLFCDTSLITIKIWAVHQFNKVPDFITNSIKPSDYDLYLITNNDVPWVKDSQRKDADIREHLFKWNKHELQKLNVDYKIIKGLGDARLTCAINLINEAFAIKQ